MNNMKKQGKKMIQTNLDSIVIESSFGTVEEMSEKEFRICIIKMIHEAKDEIREKISIMLSIMVALICSPTNNV